MPKVKESGKNPVEYSAPVKIDITPEGWLVQAWLGWDFPFDDLPQAFKAKRKPCSVAIVPVLISEGINEKQSMANVVGFNSLQNHINSIGIDKFEEYYGKLCSEHPEAADALSHKAIIQLFAKIRAAFPKVSSLPGRTRVSLFQFQQSGT